jgi:hypothetical protein
LNQSCRALPLELWHSHQLEGLAASSSPFCPAHLPTRLASRSPPLSFPQAFPFLSFCPSPSLLFACLSHVSLSLLVSRCPNQERDRPGHDCKHASRHAWPPPLTCAIGGHVNSKIPSFRGSNQGSLPELASLPVLSPWSPPLLVLQASEGGCPAKSKCRLSRAPIMAIAAQADHPRWAGPSTHPGCTRMPISQSGKSRSLSHRYSVLRTLDYLGTCRLCIFRATLDMHVLGLAFTLPACVIAQPPPPSFAKHQ